MRHISNVVKQLLSKLRLTEGTHSDNMRLPPSSEYCRLHLEALEDRRMLATITVTDDGDVFNLQDTVTTLREAVFQANQSSAFDTIKFDLNDGGPATIQLTSGAIEITTSLKVEGGYYAINRIEVIAFDQNPTSELDGNSIFEIVDTGEGPIQ